MPQFKYILKQQVSFPIYKMEAKFCTTKTLKPINFL